MAGYFPDRPRKFKTQEETYQVKRIRRNYCLSIELAGHR